MKTSSCISRVGVFLGCFLVAASAFANTVTVTSLADSGAGSLRDAIPDTSDGGTIIFDPSLTGTITLTSGELDLGRNVTITGPGATVLTISGNNASRVFNIGSGATVSISGLTISGGFNQGTAGGSLGANGQGGGVINSGALTLTTCALTSNSAKGALGTTQDGNGLGGAIFSDSDGQLTLVSCTLSANSALGGGTGGDGALTAGSGFGGGIYLNEGSSAFVTNCTIANNSAFGLGGSTDGRQGGDGVGGGIYDNTAAILRLVSCTISGNTSKAGQGGEGDGVAEGGGIGIIGSASPTVENTIVSGNSVLPTDNCACDITIGPDVYGTVVSGTGGIGGFNLIGQTNGSSGWIASGNGMDLVGSTDFPLDPQLGSLQGNGGPTSTMALAPSSAAVDQGYSFGLTSDQRGFTRPVDYLGMALPPDGDSSDIGAFELQSAVTEPTAVTVSNLFDNGTGSLRYAIDTLAPNGIISFEAGLAGTITLTSGELDLGRNVTITGPGATVLTISGNNASRVFNIGSGATVSISGLTISGGFNQGTAGGSLGANGQGGGVINSGALTLTTCALTSNSAKGALGTTQDGNGLGGAIFSDSDGQLTLVSCTLSANSALGGGTGGDGALTAGSGFGGGIYLNEGSSAFVTNCTIANNSAFGLGGSIDGRQGGDGVGGGIYDNTAAILRLVSCTISGNTSKAGQGGEGDGVAEGGGIGIIGSASPTVENTIVSGNSVLPTGNCACDITIGPDVYGTVVSGTGGIGGFNLIGQTNGSSGWIASGNGMDLVGNANQPLSAGLGLLQNNGGPTPTMALADNSYAIDQGYSFGLTSDQRGSFRPVDFASVPNAPGGDGSDIGAYELSAGSPVIAVTYHPPLPSAPTTPSTVPPAIGFKWTEPLLQLEIVANFRLQSSSGPMNSGNKWSDVRNPVRLIKGAFVARDAIMASNGSPFLYRLLGPMGNPYLLPQPLSTLQASNITATSAMLNGSDVPVGYGTAYWFEYGFDTNYGTNTVTNSVATASNSVILSCSATGLSSSTTYHFQLVAADDDGTLYGGDQSFTTSAAGPPPTSPSATTTSGTPVTSVSEQLHGIVNPNGANATYWFEYGLDTNYSLGNTAPAVVIWTNNPLPLLNNAPVSSLAGGLAASTTYHFQLVASNSAGVTLGGDLTFTTTAPPTPPAAVTQAASAITSVNAQLNGTINPDGADTTWWFEYGYDTNYSIANTASAVVSASNTNPVPVNILAGGLNVMTTYHFQLVGSNSAGVSYGGDQSFTTQGVPPTLVTLAATSITSNSVVLNGTIDANGSQGLGRFQYGTDTNYTGGQVGNYFTSFNNDTEAYSFTLTGLSPGTTYHYQAFGYNCCVEGYGADANFTTAGVAGPPPPSAPTLVSPGTNSPVGPYVTTLTPTFTWNTNGSASYGLYLAEYPSGAATQSFNGLTGGSSAPATLQPGTNYYWYMTGFDSLGNQSSGSASLYFQTPAAPIAITEEVTNIGPSTATFYGSVNPNGLAASVQFQYGLASGTNYNLVVPTNPTNIGTAEQIYSQNVTGLFVGTSYHFRFVAVNSLGTTYGAPIQFMTSAE